MGDILSTILCFTIIPFVVYEYLEFMWKTYILWILKKLLYKRAIKFCENNLKELPPVAISSGYFNAKCHWNSYAEHLIHEDNDVVACIGVENGEPFVHFINYNIEKDYYYDITLGCRANNNILYEIGIVEFDEPFVHMDRRLQDVKYWIIDRSFELSVVRWFYKRLEDRYCII